MLFLKLTYKFLTKNIKQFPAYIPKLYISLHQSHIRDYIIRFLNALLQRIKGGNAQSKKSIALI